MNVRRCNRTNARKANPLCPRDPFRRLPNSAVPRPTRPRAERAAARSRYHLRTEALAEHAREHGTQHLAGGDAVLAHALLGVHQARADLRR
eukprot:83460-Pyramimonas_sp.AAC.1